MYPMLSLGSPSVQNLIITKNGAVQHTEYETPVIDVQINFGYLADFKRQINEKLSNMRTQVEHEQGGDSAIRNIQPVLKMEGVNLDKAFQPAIDAQMKLSTQQNEKRNAIKAGIIEKMAQTRMDVGQSIRANAGQTLGGLPVTEAEIIQEPNKEQSLSDTLKSNVKKHLKPWMVLAGLAVALLVVGYFIWLIHPKAPFAAE